LVKNYIKTQNMNSKNPTIKILTIAASAVILLSFFLPWINSFGQTVSAAKIISLDIEVLQNMNKMKGHDLDYALIPLSLLVMPICSFIVLLTSSISKTFRPMRLPKILMGAIMTVYLGFLLYGESNNPLSSFGGSLFSALGIGFYLTFLNVIFLFITIFMKEKNVLQTVNNTVPASQRFCSGCGKAFNAATAGQFCENCGEKL
jgi:hypothetical protein